MLRDWKREPMFRTAIRSTQDMERWILEGRLTGKPERLHARKASMIAAGYPSSRT
jgi:hypothetical protein